MRNFALITLLALTACARPCTFHESADTDSAMDSDTDFPVLAPVDSDTDIESPAS